MGSYPHSIQISIPLLPKFNWEWVYIPKRELIESVEMNKEKKYKYDLESITESEQY